MFNSDTPPVKMIMYTVLFMVGLLFVVRLYYTYNEQPIVNQSNNLTICDCEAAYRAIMYGEGSHSVDKYTGKTYNTLDANGNAYIDVIDKCAAVWGGVPLNEGGFSKHPEYQQCIASKNDPVGSEYPDTLVVQWNEENTHLYELDKIGGYLYGESWNPKGFVIVYSGRTQDNYGNYSVKNLVQTHYKVSKRFQLEAKKFASADYYRWKTWTNQEPGKFGSFIKCMETHTTSAKTCDCTYILGD